MASEVRFAANDSALYYSGTGQVSGQEVLAAARGVLSLARTLAVERILVDLSQAVALEITTSQVRELASINVETSQFSTGARLAVAAPKPYVFGIARMWSVFVDASAWEIQIFRDRQSAVLWLGIPPQPENSVALDLSP
jgi:hypothetical protein